MILLLVACNNSPTANQQETSAATTPIVKPATNESTPSQARRILFFGNSLTAGYGLDPDQAFPALVQKRIDSLGLGYEVVNGGLSGETSAGGKSRIDWVLQQPVEIFILELGANDALRGLDLKATVANLQDILDQVKSIDSSTKLVIAGMKAPPNMGSDYTTTFDAIFSALAQANEAALIPFLLQNVASIPGLNLADGIHPNADGQQIVLENVWAVLEPLLEVQQ